jgi:hypothetical protein
MISITVIDSLYYTSSIKALEKTIETLGDKISMVYWISDIDYPETKLKETNWIKIPKITNYNEDYSRITLNIMPKVCKEYYNLIIHADGFAVNPTAWTDEFLEYDYVGAAWVNGMVGNGGFCMRSKKLFDALLDMNVGYTTSDYGKYIDNPEFYVISNGERVIPEDNIICKIHKPILEKKYGIKFAPTHLAHRFSVEHCMDHEWVGKSLGFHGKHGIAKHYGIEL